MINRQRGLSCLWLSLAVTGLRAPARAPRAPRRTLPGLRSSSADTLYGPTSSAPAAAAPADEPADEDDPLREKPLPEGAAGVDMFGNPVTADGRPVGADGIDDPAAPSVDDLAAPSEPVEEFAAAAAFEADVAGPDASYDASNFFGSEWKIGVLWRDKQKIDVTWVRCLEDGTAEFGWGATGKWRLDDGCFLTFTRDFPLGWNGKRLLSARVGADANFVEGVVRGWKPFESASVMGQWQGIRLGVSDRGTAPWMAEEEAAAEAPKAEFKQGRRDLRADARSAEVASAARAAAPTGE